MKGFVWGTMAVVVVLVILVIQLEKQTPVQPHRGWPTCYEVRADQRLIAQDCFPEAQ